MHIKCLNVWNVMRGTCRRKLEHYYSQFGAGFLHTQMSPQALCALILNMSPIQRIFISFWSPSLSFMVFMLYVFFFLCFFLHARHTRVTSEGFLWKLYSVVKKFIFIFFLNSSITTFLGRNNSLYLWLSNTKSN